MNKILMYDKYDETYREVIDVKELKEYILKRIEEIEKDYVSENGYNALSSIIDYLKEKLEDK